MSEPPRRRSVFHVIVEAERIVERHGHGVMTVDDYGPGRFAYSYGLARHFRPEFLVLGLPPALAGDVIDAAGASGVRFEGDYEHILKGRTARFVSAPAEHKARMSFARLMAPDGEFEALQILCPNSEGRFPGEEGRDRSRHPRK